MAGKVVSGFEIFSEFMNGLKVEAIEEAPIEELIIGSGSDKDVVIMEPKDADGHDKEQDFETFINNSFIDFFMMMILMFSLLICLRLMIFSFPKLMQ